MSSSPIKSEQFHLKPPFKNKTQQFQQKCGECLLAMQQYKLKSHLLGCNMSKQEFKKYYNYYQTKPTKRLQLINNKLQSLMHIFERNAIYFQALQLKSLNNMMKAYRKRMNLSSNQPTAYSFMKFQLDQQELTDLIILNDTSKLTDVQKIINKIKIAQQNAAATLQQKLQANKTKKPYFARVLKTINKCQVQYYKNFQTFQRSIVNMINQIHSHMQKLNQFYTLWENLGTSIIYQMKSDRQVLIDKTAEQRYSQNYLGMDQDEDQIMQVIDIVPPGSRVYQNYKQKIQKIKTKSSRIYASNTSTSFSQAILNKKNKKGNLKIPIQSINKVSWFQTESEDLKQYNFNGNVVLKEKEDGFFRYTFEELHNQTNQYIDQIKNKNSFQDNNQKHPNDRFFLYCQKQIKKKSSDPVFKLQKYNVPPHMNFNCWYDRIGSKGAFAIQDFPMNMFQRKVQFELDRQIQMNAIDEKLRKQYYAKQSKLNIRLDSSVFNIGYRELNQAEQTRKMREYLINLYDPDNFPLIKPVSNKSKFKDKLDFSDSDEQQKDKTNKNIKIKQQQIEGQMYIGQNNDKLKNVNEHNEQNSNKHKYSNQLANKLHQHKKFLLKLHENRNEPKQKILIQNLKHTYPWLQIKQKQKQSIQVFAQRYLPQYDKMLTNKIKNDVLTMGYTEDEVQIVSFKYLQNYQLDVIHQCIYARNVPIDDKNNIKIQRQNLNKIYLLNNKLYAKIQPLFFHQSTKIIKIYICMISQLAQFQKLKSNLEKVLIFYGKCKFHLNLELIDSKYGDKQKLFGLIGHLIRNLKLDKNLNNIFESCDNNIDYLQLIKQGKKVYEAYTTYQNYLKQK